MPFSNLSLALKAVSVVTFLPLIVTAAINSRHSTTESLQNSLFNEFTELNSKLDALLISSRHQCQRFEPPPPPRRTDDIVCSLNSRVIQLENEIDALKLSSSSVLPTNPLSDECEQNGRVYFASGDQCLKLIRMDINFEPARDYCKRVGGDMWIPDLSNPDLIKDLVREYPDILTASNEDFWVGVMTSSGRLITVNGDDVTDTYFGILSDVNNGGVANGGCIIIDFKDGNPRFEAKGCSGGNKTDFICEFKLKSKESSRIKRELSVKKMR